MKRVDSKKEFIEAVFTGNEKNKNLAFEVDSNGTFIVLNRKSGIYDKPCAPKQEINLKKNNRALIDRY